MKKINILKESKDFERIIKNNKSHKSKLFFIYLERKNEDNYHFGISVGKKIGNAVKRNKVKRQIKEILSKNIYQNNFNCIIIVRREIINYNFQDIKQELENEIKKLKIIKEIK